MRKAMQNFSWLVIGDLVGKGLNFLIMIYLARVLGAAAFGYYNFAQAFLIYLLLAVDAGLSLLGTRNLAADPSCRTQMVFNIFILRFLLAVLTFIFSALIVLFVPLSVELRWLFIGTFLFVFYRALNIEWAFQGLEKMNYVAWSRITFYFLAAVLVVGGIKQAADLYKVPFMYLSGGAISGICFLAILLKFYIPITRVTTSPTVLWSIFIRALPLGLSAISIQFYYNIDTIILGFMDQPAAVGYYNAAYKVVFILLNLGSVVGMASFPVLTRYFKESKDQMVALALLMLKIMLWLACPLVLGGVVLARPIIFCLYGSEYLPAVTAFQLLIFSVLTVYTSTPFSSSLLAAQKYNQYFYSVLVGAIVNIVANLYLIPHYSLIGAAVATLISEILVWSLLYYYYSRHVARVPAGKNLLAFGSCAGLMAVLVYSIGLIWPLKALLGAGFYLLVSFGLRLITWDEIRTVFWKES